MKNELHTSNVTDFEGPDQHDLGSEFILFFWTAGILAGCMLLLFAGIILTGC